VMHLWDQFDPRCRWWDPPHPKQNFLHKPKTEWHALWNL
jgi:hypothetical protein